MAHHLATGSDRRGTEVCGDNEDNDCNGTIDDAELCEAPPQDFADPAGCGCQSNGGGGLGALLLGLLGLVMARRRRRPAVR